MRKRGRSVVEAIPPPLSLRLPLPLPPRRLPQTVKDAPLPANALIRVTVLSTLRDSRVNRRRVPDNATLISAAFARLRELNHRRWWMIAAVDAETKTTVTRFTLPHRRCRVVLVAVTRLYG